MPRKLIKSLSFLLSFLLIFEQSGLSQVAGQLDISGRLAEFHNSLIQDKFRPLHLRYLSYDNIANSFKLLLDKGDFEKGLSPLALSGVEGKGTVPSWRLEGETKTLLNYFFVGLTLPNESFWVNLRPDSEDNIIDDELAKTDVGKILLEADLQLKKDTAGFTSPGTLEGKEYWDKLYKKAAELFPADNITIPTLTRPWIVPNEIIVRETETNAYIYKATLKVLIEEDYLSGNGRDRSLLSSQPSQSNYQPLTSNYSFSDPRLKELNEYSTQLIRENIIPKLSYEVNTSKRYAPLRQVYYSLILAQWFKSRFNGRGGLYPWLIDKKNLTGLTSQDPWSKSTYFKAYQKSFRDGEYNLKEPVLTPFGQAIRSYISGGIGFTSETVSSAIKKGLISGNPSKFSYNPEKTVPVLVSGGKNVSSPFVVGIELLKPGPPPDATHFRLERIKVLTPATPIEGKTETSSPLMRSVRMAKRFVLSISTLPAIVSNLINHSLDALADVLTDGYYLFPESKLWRFFLEIRVFLPLSIRLYINKEMRFYWDYDSHIHRVEVGNIKIRFLSNEFEIRKGGEEMCSLDTSDENNYLFVRKKILRMLSPQIKRTKDIKNGVHFLSLESGYNIQNFVELAQREGYAEFLGEILALVKELKSSYGVEYVYPEAILKLFPEKEKILSQLKSIKDILPEFKYEMGVGKEIIYPIEYLAMNWSKSHPMSDRQLVFLIHTFNPKLLSWDIENAKTIFFRLGQPPSLLLCLLDGSLNKEIRESEGDSDKLVIEVLRKPALKVEKDGSFKIKGVVPDLKLIGLKKDLVLAYCNHKAFRGIPLLSDLPARKVDNVLPLDFLAEIKKDDELLPVFMGRLDSHRDEFLDNLQNILSIFNPPLLGNIQNIKVIFEDLNRPVFLISPILDGSINEVFLEAKDGGGEFIKNFLNSTIKLSFKKALLRHIFGNEKLVEEYRPFLFEFLGKYPGEFEGYFPGITFLCSSHKSFIETLFYGDLRDFSLNKDNIELVRILIRVAADPAIGPERILSRDNNGRYYIIEKLKLFASLGLTNYAQYAVKFPEGTDIVLNSPKFIRLLKEGESALKEFGARTGEGEPTILSIISDIFAVLQVVSSSERKEIAGLFEGEYIYTLSALDIPYFIENYIVYPEATKLALDYGQLNRYYIELINESLGADKLKTEEGLRQGLYGKQLLAFVNGKVTSENITRLREKRKKDNEQIRKEVIAEINNNPDFLESSLLDILSRAKEHGLIVSLLSGSSRNPLARYFLKDKFSKEELSKRTKNKDIDIRIKELLFSQDDLLNQSLGCSEEIISLLRERLGDRKIWIPAFEDSIESKIKRFDRAALENLHIKRYMDILDSSLGRELLRGKLASLYASNAAGADINKDKVREVFNQESSEEFMVLENVVALVKRLTLSRIQEAGIAVDIRGDYSAVTRGDTNINTIEIFYNKEGKLDIFDPELGLLDFKEGKVRISAGSQAIYGNHRPINVMVTSVSEVALGDALRLFRHKTQFDLELNPEDVKVVKKGLDLLTHKGNSKFLVDKIQRNAEKVLEFLHDEAMDFDQIRSLLENLGGIHSAYPFLFRNIFERSMQAAADNVLYQYLSAEQRIRYLKGEIVYFENIAIHQSGGTAQGEVFKEVPAESIIKDKGLRPGSGQGQTKGNPAVYFGTDSARSWEQRNNEILFIYDQQVLKALISGELKYGDKPLSGYGAYFNEATKHYVMSLPKGKEDVLPLRFAKMVYLTSELYIKAEAAWRRILNSAILEEVINNSQIPISNKHDKIAEVKTKLSEEYFGRSTEGNIRTFEDVFKNIFSVRFIKPRANTVLFMIADAVAYEEDGLAEELRSIAVEVFQKTNEEVAEAIKIGQEKAGRIFREDEAGIASSSVVKKDDSVLGLCLTPDSLITLADGSQKPLIELKPFADLSGRLDGDMVLSLNEATSKLEPHRVLALLDMGVKPVYRITTESGKSLKTTLTHPYLTMEGWKKLQDIRVGEEVATVYEESKNVLQNSLNLFYGKSRQISHLLTDENLVYGNDFTHFNNRGFGKISLLDFISTEKIFVCRDYFGDIRGNGYSDDIAVSYVKFTGRDDYRRPLFKSGKIRKRKGNENDISLFKGYHRCCLQDYSRSQRNFPLPLREGYRQGISLAGGVNPEGVVFVPQAVIEKFPPQPFPGHSFALSFPPKLKYTIFSSLLSRLIFPSAFAQDEPSDILWDKIISIEPLGPMPVYDIEVEATHNFIAQGIVAHNTYIKGAVSSAIGEEEKKENLKIDKDFVNEEIRSQLSEVMKRVEDRSRGVLSRKSVIELRFLDVEKTKELQGLLIDKTRAFTYRGESILIDAEIDKVFIGDEEYNIIEFVSGKTTIKDIKIRYNNGVRLLLEVLVERGYVSSEILKADSLFLELNFNVVYNKENEQVYILFPAQGQTITIDANMGKFLAWRLEAVRNEILLHHAMLRTKGVIKFDISTGLPTNLKVRDGLPIEQMSEELRNDRYPTSAEIILAKGHSHSSLDKILSIEDIIILAVENIIADQPQSEIVIHQMEDRFRVELYRIKPERIEELKKIYPELAALDYSAALFYATQTSGIKEWAIEAEKQQDEYFIIEEISSNSSPLLSAPATRKDLGGVDFIRLPIVTQQEITPRSIMAGSPQINLSRLDLGEEWLQIQNMLNAGITPSTERIREYVASSCIREDEDFNREIDKILSCIVDILRLQEERVAVTEPALREILVLLESDKPAMELQLALSKITVLPKEYTRKN